ncbi:MAG: YraN family protein [Syntrophales bacterium]|jgi:putative endonuclease|nr:YraN family protein [Syntrophales bacterium]
MTFARLGVGKRGEELAAVYLAKVGYRIIERNYRCIFGEIDIVAEEGGSIVFIEVKSRRSIAYGDPQLAVGARKQKKISMVALNYIEEKHQHSRNARFDVVAVKILPAGTNIELIKNAFELAF